MTYSPTTRFGINLTRIATVSLLLLGTVVLWGCDQQPGVKTEKAAEPESTPKAQSTAQAGSKASLKAARKLNAALDAVARNVAAAMKHRQVRTLIKKETGTLLTHSR